MEDTQPEIIRSDQWDGKMRWLVKTECQHCQKIFYSRKDSKSRFCSDRCSKSAFSKAHRVDVKCWSCGKETSKSISKAANSKHGVYFCSRKCKDEGQSIEGGCKEIQPPHFGTGVHNYRNRHRPRLKDGCVDCGEKRIWLLQFHHIDGDRGNNKRDNLEVVCNNDHQKRHLRLNGEGEWIRDNRSLTPRDILGSL